MRNAVCRRAALSAALSLLPLALVFPAMHVSHAAVKDEATLVGAAGDQREVLRNDECDLVLAAFARPIEQVEAFVPDRYELLDNGDDTVDVIVNAQACASKGLPGLERPTVQGSFQVFVEDPDGVQPGEDGGALGVLNEYVFFWALDNREAVNWLGQGTGTSASRVLFADELEFRFDPLLGVADPRFLFRSGSSVPSPFQINAVAQDPVTALELRVVEHVWLERSEGPTRVEVEIEDFRLGLAGGRIATEPGTEMATILGDGSVPMDPDSVTGSWTRSSYRKQACRWKRSADTTTGWIARC